jgi:hypothetical protein
MVEEDLKRQAVAVLFVQVGAALLDFPTTSRSHPSSHAYLQLSPRWSDRLGHREYFPMRVRWDYWQNVVVPVLADESLRVQVAKYQEAIGSGNFTLILDDIRVALKRGAEANGFLPVEQG